MNNSTSFGETEGPKYLNPFWESKPTLNEDEARVVSKYFVAVQGKMQGDTRRTTYDIFLESLTEFESQLLVTKLLAKLNESVLKEDTLGLLSQWFPEFKSGPRVDVKHKLAELVNKYESFTVNEYNVKVQDEIVKELLGFPASRRTVTALNKVEIQVADFDTRNIYSLTVCEDKGTGFGKLSCTVYAFPLNVKNKSVFEIWQIRTSIDELKKGNIKPTGKSNYSKEVFNNPQYRESVIALEISLYEEELWKDIPIDLGGGHRSTDSRSMY